MANQKFNEDDTQLERRLNLQRLLHEAPGGLRASELASRLVCSTRTVQRDIDYFRVQLEESGAIDPLQPGQDRYRLRPGEFPIPILKLTKHEARALLFSLRLLSQSSTEQDADTATLLDKLAAVFPGPLAEQIRFTRQSLEARPRRKSQTDCLRVLSDAWMSESVVCMRYRAVGKAQASMICFEPYLLEPSASTGATYVVGYNHTAGRLGTFKLDRVERVERHHKMLCSDGLEKHTPASREASAALMTAMSRSWSGVVLADTEFDAVVEFSGDAAVRARESRWHPDAAFTDLGGGHLRMEVRLPALFDFLPWVLSWGNSATVIAPPELVEMLRAATN